MKVGYIQTDPVFGNKEHNFGQVNSLASGLQADLLVLPELFATGYAFTSVEEARSLPEPAGAGPTSEFLKNLSVKTGAAIVAGFIEEYQGKIFNSSLLVSDDRVIGTYRKIHLFNKEKLWFTPGDQPLEVHTIGGFRIGIMICFDWFFPETARKLALLGAQVIAHPSNLVMPWCQRSMPTRCLENRVFAITANRIGRETRGEDDFLFTGASQITSINGGILSQAPVDQIFADVVDLDPDQADNKMINSFNDLLKDRRPEFY